MSAVTEMPGSDLPRLLAKYAAAASWPWTKACVYVNKETTASSEMHACDGDGSTCRATHARACWHHPPRCDAHWRAARAGSK